MPDKGTITDPVSDDNNSNESPASSDSTYNLEDHIRPPVIPTLQLSGSGTDFVEEFDSDVSDDIIPPYLFFLPPEYIIPPYLFYLPPDYIIPPYLFQLPPNRALNMEFNQCLLLDYDPEPSTSCYVVQREIMFDAICALRAVVPTVSSESLSSRSSRVNNNVKISLQDKIQEEESISTDYEMKSDNSTKTRPSSSIESSVVDVQDIPDAFNVDFEGEFEIAHNQAPEETLNDLDLIIPPFLFM